ncbi:hypothetical protein QJQ45_014152 [Haematococcus lacustris]|nr:hypothetical protein QJQ45_014152 [Haematococcus lacustris]
MQGSWRCWGCCAGGVPPMFAAAGPIPSFPAAPLDPDRRHNAATQPYYPAPATFLPSLAQPQGSPPAGLPPASPLGPLPSHTSLPSPSSPLPSVSPNPLLLPPLGPQLLSHPHAGLPLSADLPSFPSQVPLGPAWKSSSPLPQLAASDSSPSHVSAHHANQHANHHHANHQPQQQDSSSSLAGWGPAPPEAAMAGGLKPRPSLSHAPNTAVTTHHMGEGPGAGGGVGPKVVTHHPKGMKDMQLELAVLKTIKAREEVLERLRCAVQKLDTTLGGVAPMALPLGDPLMRLVFRLVGQLRARTLDCVEALGCWHRRTASPTPFMFYGSNYLVGIGHDLVRVAVGDALALPPPTQAFLDAQPFMRLRLEGLRAVDDPFLLSVTPDGIPLEEASTPELRRGSHRFTSDGLRIRLARKVLGMYGGQGRRPASRLHAQALHMHQLHLQQQQQQQQQQLVAAAEALQQQQEQLQQQQQHELMVFEAQQQQQAEAGEQQGRVAAEQEEEGAAATGESEEGQQGGHEREGWPDQVEGPEGDGMEQEARAQGQGEGQGDTSQSEQALLPPPGPAAGEGEAEEEVEVPQLEQQQVEECGGAGSGEEVEEAGLGAVDQLEPVLLPSPPQPAGELQELEAGLEAGQQGLSPGPDSSPLLPGPSEQEGAAAAAMAAVSHAQLPTAFPPLPLAQEVEVQGAGLAGGAAMEVRELEAGEGAAAGGALPAHEMVDFALQAMVLSLQEPYASQVGPADPGPADPMVFKGPKCPAHEFDHLPACLPAYFTACLPAYFTTCLPAYFTACLPAYFTACLPAYFTACLPAYFTTCLPAYFTTCLPAYFTTCLPAYFTTCLPAYFTACLPAYFTACSLTWLQLEHGSFTLAGWASSCLHPSPLPPPTSRPATPAQQPMEPMQPEARPPVVLPALPALSTASSLTAADPPPPVAVLSKPADEPGHTGHGHTPGHSGEGSIEGEIWPSSMAEAEGRSQGLPDQELVSVLNPSGHPATAAAVPAAAEAEPERMVPAYHSGREAGQDLSPTPAALAPFPLATLPPPTPQLTLTLTINQAGGVMVAVTPLLLPPTPHPPPRSGISSSDPSSAPSPRVARVRPNSGDTVGQERGSLLGGGEQQQQQQQQQQGAGPHPAGRGAPGVQEGQGEGHAAVALLLESQAEVQDEVRAQGAQQQTAHTAHSPASDPAMSAPLVTPAMSAAGEAWADEAPAGLHLHAAAPAPPFGNLEPPLTPLLRMQLAVEADGRVSCSLSPAECPAGPDGVPSPQLPPVAAAELGQGAKLGQVAVGEEAEEEEVVRQEDEQAQQLEGEVVREEDELAQQLEGEEEVVRQEDEQPQQLEAEVVREEDEQTQQLEGEVGREEDEQPQQLEGEVVMEEDEQTQQLEGEEEVVRQEDEQSQQLAEEVLMREDEQPPQLAGEEVAKQVDEQPRQHDVELVREEDEQPQQLEVEVVKEEDEQSQQLEWKEEVVKEEDEQSQQLEGEVVREEDELARQVEGKEEVVRQEDEQPGASAEAAGSQAPGVAPDDAAAAGEVAPRPSTLMEPQPEGGSRLGLQLRGMEAEGLSLDSDHERQGGGGGVPSSGEQGEGSRPGKGGGGLEGQVVKVGLQRANKQAEDQSSTVTK